MTHGRNLLDEPNSLEGLEKHSIGESLQVLCGPSGVMTQHLCCLCYIRRLTTASLREEALCSPALKSVAYRAEREWLGLTSFPYYSFPSVRGHLRCRASYFSGTKMLCVHSIMAFSQRDRMVDYMAAQFKARIEPAHYVPVECCIPRFSGLVVASQELDRMDRIAALTRNYMVRYDRAVEDWRCAMGPRLRYWDDRELVVAHMKTIRERSRAHQVALEALDFPSDSWRLDLSLFERCVPQAGDFAGVFVERTSGAFDEEISVEPDTPSSAESSVPSVSTAESEYMLPFEVAKSRLMDMWVPPEHTQALKTVESYSLLAYDLMSCVTFSDFSYTIYRFVHYKYDISIVDVGYRWIADVVGQTVSVTPQEGVFDALGQRTPESTTWETIKGSAILGKMKKVAALISTLAMCSVLKAKPTSSKFEEIWQNLSTRATTVDLLSQILSGMTWIYDSLVPVITGKMSVMDIFRQVEPAKQLDLDFAKLLAHRDAAARDPTLSVADLESAYQATAHMEAVAHTMIKRTSLKGDRMALVSQAIKIGKLKDEFLELIRAQPLRKAPLGILLHGPTSVGKSCAVGMLGPVMQVGLGVTRGTRHVYNLNGDDKYMSGYEYFTNLVVMDDVANTTPNFVERAPTATIIDIINNNPRTALMADVDSKGKIPICPAGLICTTNDRTLGAATYSVLPLSISRRFKIHMSLRLKPEFCKPGTNMFDSSVDPDAHGGDLWHIDLEEAIQGDIGKNAVVQVAYRPLEDAEGPLMNIGMPRALRYIAAACHEHAEQQARLLRSAAAMQVKPMCEHGLFADMCDICPRQDVVSVQAGAMWALPAAAATKLFFPKGSWWRLQRNVALALLMLKHRRERLGYFVAAHLAAGGLVPLLLHCIADFARVTSALLCLLTVLVLPTYCVYRWLLRRAENMSGRDIIELLRDVTPYEVLVRRARDRMTSPRVVATMALLSVATAVSVVYATTRKKDKAVPQGSRVSMPDRVKEREKPDPWRKPYVTPSTRNQDTITSTGGQLAAVLCKKTCVMELFDSAERGTRCLALPICTNFWLAPYHVVERKFENVSLQHVGSQFVNYRHVFKREGSYTRIGDSDLAVVYVPGRGDQMDLTHFFASCKTLPKGKFDLKDTAVRLCYAQLTKTTDDAGNEFTDVRRQTVGANASSMRVQAAGLDYSYDGCRYMLTCNTWDGLCGAPVCTEGPGPVLLGAHSAGETGTPNGRCSVVTREEVLAAIARATRPETAQLQGAEMGDWIEALSHPDLGVMALPELAPNSYCNYAEGDWEVLGRTNAQKRTFRSQVVATPMSPLVEEVFGVPIAHGPPAYLNTWVPFNDFLVVAGSPRAIPQRLLDLAYNDYRTKVFMDLEERDDLKRRIHPFCWDAVVGGADGVAGCYSMNMKASAGFPWSRPKSEFFPINPDKVVPGQSVSRDIPDWLLGKLEELEEKAARGERFYAPQRGNLKDEAVKLTKDKVRLFSGSNVLYLMLMRKYFLPILIIMHEMGDTFETAVGVNCCSSEWEQLRMRAVRYGRSRMIAGDYTDFDKQMASAVVYATFKLLIAIAEWAGYSKRQLRIMVTLATETASPVYEMMCELLRMSGSNPAGHPGTVDVNGCVNALYVRVGWYDIKPAAEMRLFHETVSLITYGDDNVMSVIEDCPWFNHTTLQGALAQFGVKYTMADKTAASRPYIDIKEVSFLKRGFVWSQDLEKWVAPLERASIFKMLHTVNKSSAISMEEQQAEVLANANREFFLHGREDFLDAHEKLRDIAERMELTHYLAGCKLQSYGELADWLDSQG